MTPDKSKSDFRLNYDTILERERMKPIVSKFRLTTKEGKHIRWATKVKFDDGYEVKFIELMSKYRAIEHASAIKEVAYQVGK